MDVDRPSKKKSNTGDDNPMNQAFIGWFPMDVAKWHVHQFVKKAVKERPLRIEFLKSKRNDDEQAAFVAMRTRKLLNQVISKLNGTMLGSKKVTVEAHLPHRTRKREKLFEFEQKEIRIGNLNRRKHEHRLTEKVISEHIMEHSKAKMPPISVSLRQSTFNKIEAVIEMNSRKDALAAIQNVTMTSLRGVRCYVEMSVKKDRKEELRGKTDRLFISNLRDTIGRVGLIEMCKEYCDVEPERVELQKLEQWHRQFDAVVLMESNEDAARVFDALHMKVIEGKVIKTRFLPKEGRKTRKMNLKQGPFLGAYKMGGGPRSHLWKVFEVKEKRESGIKY